MTVEWKFLEAVLLQMGFDQNVIKLFMSCISSVHYKIYHAGRIFGSIIQEQGLRQEDPLFSYLFLICIEGLTTAHDFENCKLIKGIKVARSAPSISHKFFMTIPIFSCKAITDSANNILYLLKIFEQASGRQINVDKSSIFPAKIPTVH